MALNYLHNSQIIPAIQGNNVPETTDASNNKPLEYNIENLVLPSGLTGNDEKEILLYLNTLLAEDDPGKIHDSSQKNFMISQQLVNQIIQQKQNT